ncbi:hypothetical protein RGUI_1202 [Rhodovulum sp. P5]|uniref:BLUF domain-containing protein n=1 Tax=Rhodovulum sp. P5 TaxID=1564506 RepID=UPI0009C2A184|nr:BLUF domain-containing protein [Rhodovulum sp. P5]ARE39343.1 hypothetical protein RGUI_1202 [Rhodovulum sp. P5]
MTESLISMAYVSRNMINGDFPAVVAEIVSAANVRNAARGITGALVCSQGYFAQVLEGDSDKLDDLFERIVRDPRHSEVQVLFSKPIAQRSFGGWGMASAGVVEDDTLIAAIHEVLQGEATVAAHDAAGEKTVALLGQLLRERSQFDRYGAAAE